AASFRIEGGPAPVRPILSFRPGEALAVEIGIGRGRLYALADPSVLINNMLELAGNRAFAFRLVSALARPGGRLVVGAQEFTERGQLRDENGFSTPVDSLAGFNRFLGELTSYDVGELPLRALALGAAGLACALLLGGLPALRRAGPGWAQPL